MEDWIRDEIEGRILELPVVQFAWMPVEALSFSEDARYICRTECPRYGKSWSCPPGVGSVEECKVRCETYDGMFVFSTIVEVNDITNMEETLGTLPEHQAVVREIMDVFQERGMSVLALSGESCAACEVCSYPDGPCRNPDRKIACIEGYGVVVPLLAEQAGIEFENGYNVVTWFGAVLYKKGA